MKKILLGILVLSVLMALVACGEKPVEPAKESGEVVEPVQESGEVVEPADVTTEEVNVPKNEQIGTAGSNMPLKDRLNDAELEIKRAFQDYLAEAYGEKVFDARIYVEKVYTAEEEQTIEALKEKNLGPDEVAFEVRYELKPAEGVDPIEFTAANGEYEEDTGWVKNKFNLGILRPNIEGEALYRVTDLATGW
ncbi:MAG: hypothetical protein IKI57_06995 [Clostridia bacterium]|nr:hypothetical protein [Clostridia bacterium]